MKYSKQVLITSIAVSALIASTASFAVKPDERTTIVDAAVAVSTPDAPVGEFKTLVAALLAFPGILNTLDGNGQFTVFAPTDAAFDKLNLVLATFCYTDVFELAVDQHDYVADVLTYHVARGRMDAGEVLPKDQIRMLSGDFLTRVPGSLGLTDALGRTATIDAANWLNVFTDNGVIHGIDEVVLPSAPMSACSP
jgi:uncharacterized surface protein with fasciclin (FAS1) repeats